MADNFNINTTQEQANTARGLNPEGTRLGGFDISQVIAQNARQQQEHMQRIAEAKLRLKQRQEAAAMGVNPEMGDYIPVEEAVALLKANGVKPEQVDEFVQALGDKQVVSRQALQAVILKKGGTGSLSLVGAKEGQPMQAEDGKWYRTWIKRTPELGILMTDRVDENGTAVFRAENPDAYEAGKTMLSIQDPKLAAVTKTANARTLMAEVGRERQTETSWQKLQKEINVSNAPAARAIGQAAVNNMRADRALKLLNKKALTANEYDVVVSDLAAIFKGGVPDVLSLEHQRYETLKGDLNSLIQYVTSEPAEVGTPEVKDRLHGITQEVKEIDNGIILNYMDSVAAGYEPYIKANPDRFAKMVNAQLRNLGADEIDMSVIEGIGN